MNNSIIRVDFKRSCLKQDKKPFPPKNVVYLLIVYELDGESQDLKTVFSLKDCLFRAINLNKKMILINILIQVVVLVFESRSLLSILNPWG